MSSDALASARNARNGVLLLVLAYLGFISLGLPDGVLGLVWPELQELFALPRAALGVPLAVGAVTYFLSGLLAGHLTRAMGVGALLAASTGLVTVGIATYAGTPSFPIFLCGSAIIGFGSGGVDAGLNNYAARHFRARHMTWLHAAYSTGAASGPAIVTALFAHGGNFRTAYATIAGILAFLTAAFTLTRSRWVDAGERAERVAAAPLLQGGTWAALRNSRVRLQALLFFTYTGIEVGAGQWSFTLLTKGRNVDPETAGIIVTGFWVSILLGRVLSGFVVERIGTVRLVRGGAVISVLGIGLFAAWSMPVVVSAFGLCLGGLAMAPIFPGLMSETPRRVGIEAAPYAVGFQVSAATAGVAVLPNVAGVLGEWFGLSATGAFIALDAALFCVLHELLIHVADRSTTA